MLKVNKKDTRMTPLTFRRNFFKNTAKIPKVPLLEMNQKFEVVYWNYLILSFCWRYLCKSLFKFYLRNCFTEH